MTEFYSDMMIKNILLLQLQGLCFSIIFFTASSIASASISLHLAGLNVATILCQKFIIDIWVMTI